MVYTVLQLIARSREAGISVVDLSNKTGYDSKNCAYLTKQLQEMDLMCSSVPNGGFPASDILQSQTCPGGRGG